MAIDFPNSPSVNDLYTAGGKTWQWNGTYWAAYGTGPILRTSDTAPVSPNNGDLWYETDTGRFFTYYDSVWVEIGNATDIAGALQPGQVTALSAVTSLTSDDVFPVIDNPSSATAANKITYGNLVTAMSASLAPGMTHLRTTSFSTSTSGQEVPIASVFSNTYNNYRIIITGDGSVNGGEMRIRMRTGSTNASGASDYIWTYYGFFTVTGAFQGGTGAASYAYLGPNRVYTIVIDLFLDTAGSQTYTRFTYHSAAYSGNWGGVNGNGFLNTSNQSYDGFAIFPSSGTISGNVRVYGYRNS